MSGSKHALRHLLLTTYPLSLTSYFYSKIEDKGLYVIEE
jgi:hypothetical protein